jgi:hypothetical protein
MEFSDARGRMNDDCRPTISVVSEPRWSLRATETARVSFNLIRRNLTQGEPFTNLRVVVKL